MTVTERLDTPGELHFTEGEPDLEPPEELAIGELDEQAVLEEELDNEDLLEQDVDEDTLEAALDDLVHGDEHGNGGDEDDIDLGPEAAPLVAGSTTPEPDTDDDVDEEDLEESLDDVLRVRMAVLHGDPGSDEDLAFGDVLVRTRLVTTEVAPCGPDEFVCRACFLVRSRAQLYDPVTRTCRDCAD